MRGRVIVIKLVKVTSRLDSKKIMCALFYMCNIRKLPIHQKRWSQVKPGGKAILSLVNSSSRLINALFFFQMRVVALLHLHFLEIYKLDHLATVVDNVSELPLITIDYSNAG